MFFKKRNKRFNKNSKRSFLFWFKYLFKKGSSPEFIIVGSIKGGTTSLYNYLSEHSRVEPAFTKELRFFYEEFNGNFDLGYRWYKANFPSKSKLNKLNKITGEASPAYIYYPDAAKNIKKVLPNTKLILLLRNPIDQIFSHYHMRVRQGLEKESFEDIIQNLINNGFNELKENEWIKRSNYPKQLENWFEVFPDKSQTLVIKSEDFFEDTEETFRKVCQHLNIPYEKVNFTPYFKGNYSEKMNPDTRGKLKKVFEENNKKVKELVGFSWSD